ncbi:hypothetical protein G6F37_010456 [Rhizopus arrhizus]|nr:hypothetical protein G6F38_010510 [Rhizopus arrhizus]KAG1153327.1 hypothetical protein G6F37_010456 [Rhizopus arrhizus]
MEQLPANIILTILNLLPNQSSKFSFASATKQNWRICSAPASQEFKLNKRITALELCKCRYLIIRNQFYNLDYLQFVIRNAPNLSSVKLEEREMCTREFIIHLIAGCYSKKVQFVVPFRYQKSFESVVQYLKATNISVQGYGKEIEERKEEEELEEGEEELEEVEEKLEEGEEKLEEGEEKLEEGEEDAKEEEETDISKMKTPEHIQRQLEIIKRDLKLDYYKNSKVNKYCPQYVESVLILANHWFLVTSFSSFIHNNPKVDDCADKSIIRYQSNPIAFIRRKSQYGKDYFELTIRFGYVELVVTSGFFGSVDGKFYTAFLGSSIHNLPELITTNFNTTSTSMIFVSVQQKHYILRNRIMNQYLKLHSVNRWGHYSKKFEEQEFTPGNPLSFRSDNVMYNAASFIIRSYAYRNIELTAMYTLVLQILNIDDSSLTSTNKLIKKKLFELRDHRHHAFSVLPKAQLKDELITIYNKSLANGLKTYNINGIKKQNKKYLLNIDQFNDAE